MLRLFLIRHGETEWNSLNKYQGTRDIPLSCTGIKQAKLLADRMKNYKIDAVFSSNLLRAYETAENISKTGNIPLGIIPQLREINFGEWEGHTTGELKKLYGEDYERFLIQPHKYNFPGEGSMQAVQARMKKAIEIITDKHCRGNIAVVSHGGVLKILILTLLNMDLGFYKSFWLGNTSLSIIDRKDTGNWVLSLLNDSNHLQISSPSKQPSIS
ncbi:MAG: histidine phosphatase family protein [Epulopiscium sp.]|nr:histidine phosphatase family protein [Candidatus Epulonipiscium sp.]